MNYPNYVVDAINKLKNQYDNGYELSRYCVLGVEGEEYFNEECACMSGLRDCVKFTPEYLIIKVKCEYEDGSGRIENIGYEHPHFQQYIKWLLTDSPFKDNYLTSDVSEVVETECVVIRTDIPANVMLLSAAAVRYTWEFPEFIDNWYGLCEVGLSPDKALVMSHYFLVNEDGVCELDSGGHNSNHFLFNIYGGTGLLRSFSAPCDWSNEFGTFRESLSYRYMQQTFISSGVPISELLGDSVETKQVNEEGAFGGYIRVVVIGDIFKQVKQMLEDNNL